MQLVNLSCQLCGVLSLLRTRLSVCQSVCLSVCLSVSLVACDMSVCVCVCLCVAKLVPLAYGIKKLQIACVVEDDKVRRCVSL